MYVLIIQLLHTTTQYIHMYIRTTTCILLPCTVRLTVAERVPAMFITSQVYVPASLGSRTEMTKFELSSNKSISKREEFTIVEVLFIIHLTDG